MTCSRNRLVRFAASAGLLRNAIILPTPRKRSDPSLSEIGIFRQLPGRYSGQIAFHPNVLPDGQGTTG